MPDGEAEAKSPELLLAELLKAQADAAAAAAAARKAELEADKLAKENAEWEAAKDSRLREAEATADEKKLTNDEKRLANLDKQRTWITDAAPDLKDADRGKTTGADKPLFTALLATRALEKAAREVALSLWPGGTGIPGAWLLTTDESLVDRLAVYDGVTRQLEVLVAQVNEANGSVPAEPAEGESPEESEAEAGAESAGVVVAGAAAALSKMIPGLISLISANRTVAAADGTQDAYVTMLAVAGQIRSWEKPPTVLIDETRLLRGDTDVETKFGELELACHDLAVSLALIADRTDAAAVAWAKGAQTTLELARASLNALSTVADGSSVSPLMAAASQAVFADTKISHVIVIKAAGASTSQLMDDRPLTMKDPVHIVTTASIAFATIDATTSEVIRAGVKTGESSLVGKIGSTFEFDPPRGRSR